MSVMMMRPELVAIELATMPEVRADPDLWEALCRVGDDRCDRIAAQLWALADLAAAHGRTAALAAIEDAFESGEWDGDIAEADLYDLAGDEKVPARIRAAAAVLRSRMWRAGAANAMLAELAWVVLCDPTDLDVELDDVRSVLRDVGRRARRARFGLPAER